MDWSIWGCSNHTTAAKLACLYLSFCENESKSHSVMSDSLRPHGLFSPWNSPGQNTGVGSRSLLQGIFPTQGSIPGLPHCKQILYQLSHQGSPRVLEWVAYLVSIGSSPPRNRTGISFIAGGFFTAETKPTWNAVKIWLSILQFAHFQRASTYKILGLCVRVF